jgi:hypothetical protein
LIPAAGPFSAAGAAAAGGGASPRAAVAAAAAAADAAGGLMCPAGVGGCSEYCARLCEAVYTACEHALSFLLATAPVVDPGEIAAAAAAGTGGLGDTWPAAKALAGLQVGCKGGFCAVTVAVICRLRVVCCCSWRWRSRVDMAGCKGAGWTAGGGVWRGVCLAGWLAVCF